MKRPAYLYHGTRDIDAILTQGILTKHATACECQCIWLTKDPEDAEVFGDVVQIDFSDEPGHWPDGEGNWQATYDNDIPPERLTRWERSLSVKGL